MSADHVVTDGLRRRALLTTAAVLLLSYVATMAPGVTLWDAGEFQSAIATLGVPHPPGAPMYVLLGRVWTAVWPSSLLPIAINLLSAVATAGAGGIVAWLFAGWMRSAAAGAAAGIAGGLMYSVWQNATETEVYALSLLLGVVMLMIANHSGNPRREYLLSYAMGMAGPLHLDAMLAAPAAVLLVSTSEGARGLRIRAIAMWLGPLLLAVGLDKAATGLIVAGLAWQLAGVLLPLPGERLDRLRQAAVHTALVALGASGVVFMLLRAVHEPGLDQGNPSTWAGLLDVIRRVQYDVPGLWPRRAPLWLQIGNVGQYLDWQWAFGVDDGTRLSRVRTPITLGFLFLAWRGARKHWAADVRSARAWLAYVVMGSLGAMVVLNLQAGPSIGWGILPDTVGHEARERDYFFVAAFLGVAAWAAIGAWDLARRHVPKIVPVVPVVLAGVLAASNWRATDRRREPDASIASRLADALLASAPPNAVLLLAADNDSYGVWQAQFVRAVRRDVTPVTVSLLGADWYRDELRRRWHLLSDSTAIEWSSVELVVRELQQAASANGRPFAVAMSVPVELRRALRGEWRARGMVFVADSMRAQSDSITVRMAASAPAGSLTGRDPTVRYLEALLQCPSAAVARASGAVVAPATSSLDSECNF